MPVTNASLLQAATLLQHMYDRKYTPDEGIVALSRNLAVISKVSCKKGVPLDRLAGIALDTISVFVNGFTWATLESLPLFTGPKRHLGWNATNDSVYKLSTELADILQEPSTKEGVQLIIYALCASLALLQKGLTNIIIGGEPEVKAFIERMIAEAFVCINEYDKSYCNSKENGRRLS